MSGPISRCKKSQSTNASEREEDPRKNQRRKQSSTTNGHTVKEWLGNGKGGKQKKEEQYNEINKLGLSSSQCINELMSE